MNYYLGEVVRWTPGADYALVKPQMMIENGHSRNLSLREVEKQFLSTGMAMWPDPSPRCQVGRYLLFEKVEPSPTASISGRHTVAPVHPFIVINAPKGMAQAQPVEAILDAMATRLSGSGAFRLAQDFKVLLKRAGNTLEYFGPFEQKGALFEAPKGVSSIKQFMVEGQECPTVYLTDLGLEIVEPSVEISRVGTVPIPAGAMAAGPAAPTRPVAPPPAPADNRIIVPPVQSQAKAVTQPAAGLSAALEKLAKALPASDLRPVLKTLEQALEGATQLSAAERSLLRNAFQERNRLDGELQNFLPVLHRHVDYAGYFEQELARFKTDLETELRTENDQRVEATLEELAREETRLKAQGESLVQEEARLKARGEALLQEEARLRAEREALDQERARVTALAEAGTGTAPEALAGQAVRHGVPSWTPAPAPGSLAQGAPVTAAQARKLLLQHPPQARLQAAWSAGRVPLLCGPRSLQLVRRHADLACGGLLRWASVDPLLVHARDLLGTFVDGWFRPHPAGLASLLLHAGGLDHPAIVVFEGANRAPLELLLEPLLSSRDAGLPLFAPEAFRPGDPWAALGRTPWPRHLLMACTLTTGAARQPIGSGLWGHLVAIDEHGWPKTEPDLQPGRLPLAAWPGLVAPSSDRTLKAALTEFQDDVPEAEWGMPGALGLAQNLDGVDFPDAAREVQLLLLAPAALCAGAESEGMDEWFDESEQARLDRLRPFVV